MFTSTFYNTTEETGKNMFKNELDRIPPKYIKYLPQGRRCKNGNILFFNVWNRSTGPDAGKNDSDPQGMFSRNSFMSPSQVASLT
jgi:hypothetical protein